MIPATSLPCLCARRPAPGSVAPQRCGDGLGNRLVCRVIAPPEAHTKRQKEGKESSARPSTTSPSPPASSEWWSSTTSFASSLLTHFRPTLPAFAPSPAEVLREASSKERELQKAKPVVDVSAFLSPLGVFELKNTRKYSSLTALTYFMGTLTPRKLERLHGMELVTTSRACIIRPYEHSKTAEEFGADGDGMAVSVQDAKAVYRALKKGTASGGGSAGAGLALAAAGSGGAAAGGAGAGADALSLALAEAANIVALTSDVPYQPTAGAAGEQSGASAAAALPKLLRGTAAEVVAAKLAEAAASAGAVAAGSALASAAESIYAGLAALPIGGGGSSSNGRAAGSAAKPTAALPESAPVPLDGAAKPTAAAIAELAAAEVRKKALGAVTNRAAAGLAAVGASGLKSPAGPYPNGYGSAGAAVAAAIGQTTAAAPAAAAAASGADTSLSFSASPSFACPSEWFVVDEAATHTRIFVIQGSDTLDHWRLNLTFDPVVFEEPSLGVKVHRGVYEAALVLYDKFLPLVYEHLEASPFAKVTFTGHSIGGSLATLLALMFRIRGVLPVHSLSTIYTFGAPAVFCQSNPNRAGSGSGSSLASASMDGGPAAGAGMGGVDLATGPGPALSGLAGLPLGLSAFLPASFTGGSGSAHGSSNGNGNGNGGGSSMGLASVEDPMASIPSDALAAAASAAAASGPAGVCPSAGTGSGTGPHGPGCACGTGPETILSRLGLPDSIVRNVIMARDVVPRAFACDYSLVADILKGWGPSFKGHCCLNRSGRKHLYYFVGRMCILQPDSWHTFVGSDPYHPMLPAGPEAYLLEEAPLRDPAALLSALSPSASAKAPAASGTALAAPASAAAASTALVPTNAGSAPRPPARSVAEAVMELMDCPHPLETLADPGAYLASGIISRYHNPEHYTKALGRVAHLKRQSERAKQCGGGGGSGSAGGGGSDGGACGVRRSGFSLLAARRRQTAAAAEAMVAMEADGVTCWDSSDEHVGAVEHLWAHAHACH
ncbi:hypothetical protein HYH03_003917 [Edaphochlamys debaryana]|uniref:Fungal lipase-type domain-containing protein n=1 Tax=Edaphochlamys debaryana TaxID=47281 RepID=A0A836C2V6_9CHLO|nr:hypothetical protein HYH03_003917 [Edaphochlamys debaryana]|eukprot:KAG2498160.1 hypothetical protein HYH03_003917 [Edaphochlamys debaryana]